MSRHEIEALYTQTAQQLDFIRAQGADGIPCDASTYMRLTSDLRRLAQV
jgi:hypothetical protein